MRSAAQHCVRSGADLIEAGLNEGAGRFALASYGLCVRRERGFVAWACRSEANMMGLASDRTAKSGSLARKARADGV